MMNIRLNLNSVINFYKTSSTLVILTIMSSAISSSVGFWPRALRSVPSSLAQMTPFPSCTQFDQHFTGAFSYESVSRSFCLVYFGFVFFGERISVKKVCKKCWWNWPTFYYQIFDIFLSPKSYKPKLKAQKSCSYSFLMKKQLVKC